VDVNFVFRAISYSLELQHVISNPHTLLTRFFGLHRVKVSGEAGSIHFLVMGNIFSSEREIQVQYDLKVCCHLDICSSLNGFYVVCSAVLYVSRSLCSIIVKRAPRKVVAGARKS